MHCMCTPWTLRQYFGHLHSVIYLCKYAKNFTLCILKDGLSCRHWTWRLLRRTTWSCPSTTGWVRSMAPKPMSTCVWSQTVNLFWIKKHFFGKIRFSSFSTQLCKSLSFLWKSCLISGKTIKMKCRDGYQYFFPRHRVIRRGLPVGINNQL